MDQKVEIERMEAAFKRAAEKAIHGTREERAGRFEIGDQKRLPRGDQSPAKHRGGGEFKK